MSIDVTNEKRFEEDIESSFLLSGGYTKGTEVYDAEQALYVNTLIDFIKCTQPKEWARFEKESKVDCVKKFCDIFNSACNEYGLVYVLRHGFKHRGIKFRVCYFKPESTLNQTTQALWNKNVFNCNRQWHYSNNNKKSVDIVLVLNGIPVFAFELKNQYTGQSVEDAKKQWMYDRDARELCFQFNKRILGYFCVDQLEVLMTTKLDGKNTVFLPFNQGSNGAGNDGGKGNPQNPDGYVTAYLWEDIFQYESMMDILQKFIHYDSKKNVLIFPRFHQLDVVRKLIADVIKNGSGKNYLIQHSAGSGKSNSIAWTAYRLASIHDESNKAIFSSVIVITDRTVLDMQLQETISGFEHTLGSVETIGDDKTSKDLRDAINNGIRLIVTTLQKFPVIYTEIDRVKGRNYAIIVDEAHSSQTGYSAIKLKTALADTEETLKEYAEIEGKAESEIDSEDKITKEMSVYGKHKNLSFFAFTATPKSKTLEMFGTACKDGSFHPFHVYSMQQAIEEGFILNVLQNYMTYKTCYKIAKTTQENPDVPSSRAARVIRKFQELHPYNISQKSQIIVETFKETTSKKIGGKGKMMVVTSSRLAAVRYYNEIRRYIQKNEYNDINILIAFSGTVNDVEQYTESKLNVRKDGSHISENQTKEEFHDNFNILIVAEKYQTGFDEPLLHTMIIDKKLQGVKAVQTLSRLNRICEGKTDTFILDFVNTQEDIFKAFQPFYRETYLGDEINTDLIYKTQRILRQFAIYNDNDIKAFIKEYSKTGKQDTRAIGRMTSILKPVAQRYNEKTENERYQIRVQIRNLIKWYNYISQIVRMFDKQLHEEYIFCRYLIELLPEEKFDLINIEGKLKLEYYKLQKTFEGAIILQEKKGEYGATTSKKEIEPDKKEPLDEIIYRINEKYNGVFTESDRVLISTLHSKLINDKKLIRSAKTYNSKIFKDNVFPAMFEKAAQDSYVEVFNTYDSLFKDKKKYEAIMDALNEIIYREISSH